MAKTTLPALNGNDSSLRLDDAEEEGLLETESDTVVDVNLPLVGGDTTGLVVVHGVHATGEVALTGRLVVAGDWAGQRGVPGRS